MKIRTCMHNHRTRSARCFFRQTAFIFLAIRQYACQKWPCLPEKTLGHPASSDCTYRFLPYYIKSRCVTTQVYRQSERCSIPYGSEKERPEEPSPLPEGARCRQRERGAQVISRRSRFGSLLLTDHRLSGLCHFSANGTVSHVMYSMVKPPNTYIS